MRRSQPLVLALLSLSMLGPRVVNKLDFVIKKFKNSTITCPLH
jgi:hypothetical protein